jgi:predicted outer membrane repeat protein
VPVLNVKNGPIEVIGKSPRRLAGLHITKGTDGAVKASTEKLELIGMAFTDNESKNDGGAVYYNGKGTLVGKTLLFENGKGNKGGAAFIDGNAEIENLVCSGNSSQGEGGCLSVQGNLRLANAVFHGNRSKKEGGAFHAKSALVHNATVASNASTGGNAFSGASGRVYNSIFWKNSGGNVPSSWTVQHSSFNDPKFIDEKNPAGTAHFFGYDAGLVLADKSPALKGSKVEGTLEQDLLGTDRGNAVAMGAYGDYSDDNVKFQYGEWIYGKFEPTPAMPQPLFTNLPYQDAIDYVGYGGYGRMIKRLVRKHDKTKISQATVRITILDSNFKAYPDIKPVDVVFYRTDKEEDGKYVFETLTLHPWRPEYNPEKHGRLILFSMDPEDRGIHGNFLIIHVKSDTDNFRYEVVKW